jgi:hypothetical protein
MAIATPNIVTEIETVVVEKKVTKTVTLEISLNEAKGLIAFIGVTSQTKRKSLVTESCSSPHKGWSGFVGLDLSNVYDALTVIPALNRHAAAADLEAM